MNLMPPAEVELLTGYRMPSKQIAFLKRNGIPFLINAAGKPVVPADVLNKRSPTRPELGPVP